MTAQAALVARMSPGAQHSAALAMLMGCYASERGDVPRARSVPRRHALPSLPHPCRNYVRTMAVETPWRANCWNIQADGRCDKLGRALRAKRRDECTYCVAWCGGLWIGMFSFSSKTPSLNVPRIAAFNGCHALGMTYAKTADCTLAGLAPLGT